MDATSWLPLESAPTGVPVLVQFNLWNDPRNPLSEQVAWLYGGKWHVYPSIENTAYADRWKPLPVKAPPDHQ